MNDKSDTEKQNALSESQLNDSVDSNKKSQDRKYYLDDYHDEDYFRNLSNTESSFDTSKDEGFVDRKLKDKVFSNPNKSSSSYTDWSDYFFGFHPEDEGVQVDHEAITKKIEISETNRAANIKNSKEEISEDNCSIETVVKMDSYSQNGNFEPDETEISDKEVEYQMETQSDFEGDQYQMPNFEFDESNVSESAATAQVEGIDTDLPGSKIQGSDTDLPGSEIHGLETDLPVSKIQGSDTYLPGSEIHGLETDLTGSKIQGSDTDLPGSEIHGLETDLTGSKIHALEMDLPGSQIQGRETDLTGSQIQELETELPDSQKQGLATELQGSPTHGLDTDLPVRKSNTDVRARNTSKIHVVVPKLKKES